MPLALPLAELSILAVVWACIELALLAGVIFDAVYLVVHGLPVVGPPLGRAINWLKQEFTHALGKAEQGVDAAMGASWHALARAWDELWHLLKESATGYWLAAQLIGKLVYAHSGLKGVVHAVRVAVHGIEHGVRDLERKWHGIEAQVKHIEHEIANGIGNDVRTGLRDLRKEVHGIEHTVTETIPREIDYAEGLTTNLGQFIKAIPGTSYGEWVKGLAIAGLAAVGLSGLRCDNNPLKNKDCNSPVWGNLESLLGLATTVLVAADFEELIREMQGLTEGAVGTFKDAAGIG